MSDNTNTDPDTASGGAPDQPESDNPQSAPTGPESVDPVEGTDAEGKPVENPAG